MSALYTATMQGRGEVVIPAKIRNRLGLRTGDTIFLLIHQDAIVIKKTNEAKGFLAQLNEMFSIEIDFKK